MNHKIVRLPFFQNILNLIALGILALVCAFPILHTLALSLSSSSAASSGRVTLLPVEFTLQSYRFVLDNPAFLKSFGVSLLRVLVGVPVNMLLTILVAYPLSRTSREFRLRDAFAWFFLITVLFSGGLIPYYMVINRTGLIDSFWALIIPGALPVFNVVLLVNSFRNIPKELEEAAVIEGAGPGKIFWSIVLPLAKPAIAITALFSFMTAWNEFILAATFMNQEDMYTAPVGLKFFVGGFQQQWGYFAAGSIIVSIPVVVLFLYLQKYLVSGLTAGSVKG